MHVLLDIHSHLMATEVIGLLGGCFDNDKKVLRILSAHPCRTLGTGNDHLNVELDPVSQIEVVEAIASAKQQTVGWYHSHPVFRNDPSVIDVQNQMSYQSLFHGSANSRGGGGDHSSCTPTSLRSVGGLVPFVAAICTPFGSHDFRPLPSSIKYFSTITAKERKRLDSRMRGNSEPRKKAAGTEEGDDRAYRPEGKNGGGAASQPSKRARKMASGDTLALEDPVDTAVELWTSVKRSFPRKNAAATAAAAAATTGSTSAGPSTASIAAGQAGFVTPPVSSLLPVLRGLVAEYSALAHRVNFRRRWQPNDYAMSEEEESEEDASEEDDEGEPEQGKVSQSKKNNAATKSEPSSRGRSIADLANSKTASSSSSAAAAASRSSAAAASTSKTSAAADSFDADAYDDGVGGDDSASHVSRSSSPATTSLLPSSYIRTKLDQFIHSLSGHLLALESDGTKKSAHVLSTTGMRSTAAFDGGLVDERVSPFLQALRPEHQAFVHQVTQMVEGWKDGDEGEDQSEESEGEEEEEEEEEQKPAAPPKQKKKPAAAGADSAKSSSAVAAAAAAPSSKSAAKAASKSAAPKSSAKSDSAEPKPRGKPGPKPKPKPTPTPTAAASVSEDSPSPPAAAASAASSPPSASGSSATVTRGPLVQRAGKRASPPTAKAAAAEKPAAASSRQKRNGAKQQAAAAAASPPVPVAEDMSDLPVAVIKATYPASPTPPSPPPKQPAAAAAAEDVPFESSPTF